MRDCGGPHTPQLPKFLLPGRTLAVSRYPAGSGSGRLGVKKMLRNSDRQAEVAEIIAGLSQPNKMISPKYFYDERGSRLFEQICELPEYYLTRTEIGIMRSRMAEIAGAVGPRVSVIEYGIGSGLKTQILLENLKDPVAFIPIDISAELLAASAETLAGRFPQIEII